MRITHKQDKSKESYTLDPNGEILKSVRNIKDLSITISYNLSSYSGRKSPKVFGNLVPAD